MCKNAIGTYEVHRYLFYLFGTVTILLMRIGSHLLKIHFYDCTLGKRGNYTGYLLKID